jgi:hypothetical protein
MAIIKRVFSPPDHLAAQLVDPDDDDVEGSNKRWQQSRKQNGPGNRIRP